MPSYPQSVKTRCVKIARLKKRELLFCNKLDKLFDISKAAAVPEMEKKIRREKNLKFKQKTQQYLEFLKDQKEGTRASSLFGRLTTRSSRESLAAERKKEKQKVLNERRSKIYDEPEIGNNTIINSVTGLINIEIKKNVFAF